MKLMLSWNRRGTERLHLLNYALLFQLNLKIPEVAVKLELVTF